MENQNKTPEKVKNHARGEGYHNQKVNRCVAAIAYALFACAHRAPARSAKVRAASPAPAQGRKYRRRSTRPPRVARTQNRPSSRNALVKPSRAWKVLEARVSRTEKRTAAGRREAQQVRRADREVGNILSMKQEGWRGTRKMRVRGRSDIEEKRTPTAQEGALRPGGGDPCSALPGRNGKECTAWKAQSDVCSAPASRMKQQARAENAVSASPGHQSARHHPTIRLPPRRAVEEVTTKQKGHSRTQVTAATGRS